MSRPDTLASRVMVVDDDEMIRELVRAALEDAGHEVITAEDGHEALARLQDSRCDLVLSDVQMPGLDGFELVRALRSDEPTSALPIVLMTTLTAPTDVVRGLREGADDYLRKPFELPELVARVETRLDRPPLPGPGLTAARRVGVLTYDRVVHELERELSRTAGRRRPVAVAVLRFAEQEAVAERFGRQSVVDLMALAVQVAQQAAGPLDLAGLLPSRTPGEAGLVLVSPETAPAEAGERLAQVAQALAATPFTVRDETISVTPVSGWASSLDDAWPDAEQLLGRAARAAEAATDHLDLLPVRWEKAIDARPPRSRRRPGLRDRLRTPLLVAFTFFAAIVVPFLAYVALYRAGVDASVVLYPLVVATLLVTAALVWAEGFLALRAPGPPDEPGQPPPPASLVVAAYLPNEAPTILDTIEHFLTLDYPAPLQVVLAYNTPHPMPVEDRFTEIARRDHRFVPFRVDHSTSKAQNINAALAIVEGEITGIFDADHHPAPGSVERAWRWLSNGYDVVQGHCVVRNGDASWVARTVAIEFEAIYAVSHPGRTRLHGFGVFGGSNGYWRTTALREARMQGQMLTEDIDSSMRALLRGRRIASDGGLLSHELAPTNLRALWHQRMRWAQGWFQVSRRHLLDGWLSRHFTWRNRLGLFFLLGWREIYPWLSVQMFPLVAFLIWREGGADRLDWLIPVFVLTTLFTLTVGPGQTVFAYRLAADELRQRRRWFVAYLVVASLFYTELKNVIARVAQVNELTGDRRWVVTPRGAPHSTPDQ